MKMTHRLIILLTLLFTAMLLISCSADVVSAEPDRLFGDDIGTLEKADVEFTLETLVSNGKLAYRGIGGEIDGIVNPGLVVQPGAVVRIILLNGDGMQHDLFIPDVNAKTALISKIGLQVDIIFETAGLLPGSYAYYCTVPGHRQAGQEGKFVIRESQGE